MNRIKELRNLHGIKQNDLCARLDISQGTLSGWENEKYEPDLKAINNMCDVLGVSSDYLLGRTSRIECPVCHRQYDPLNEYNSAEHDTFHKLFLTAQEKCENLVSAWEASNLRNNSIRAFRKPGITLDERLTAYEEYLKYDYMDFLWRNDLNPDIEDFETYCKKDIGLATTKEALDEIDTAFYPALVNKFGIIDDEEYHKPRKPKLTSRDERDIKKDIEILREKLENKEFGPAAFDGEDISEDDTDLFLGQLELMLRRLKVKNKEKYNPHKNKSR